MTRQKQIFIICAIAFLLVLLYASYDIGTRTTFPGSKGQQKERINDTYRTKDSIFSDSVQNFEKN